MSNKDSFGFFYIPKSLEISDLQDVMILEKLQRDENSYLLRRLRDMKKYEPVLFNVDCMNANILYYLEVNDFYSCGTFSEDRINELNEIYESILQTGNNRLLAHCTRFYFEKRIKRKNRELKIKIKELLTDEVEVTRSKAILAYYLAFLNVYFLNIGVEHLFKAISSSPQLTSDDFLCSIKYHYAVLLSRQLERCKFDKSLKAKDLFGQIKEELRYARNSKELAPHCLIKLAVAYSTYELLEVDEALDEFRSVDECYQKALEISQENDAHVLEYYGRFLHKTANNSKSLAKAKEYLEKALTISPCRHVAAHNLSIVYKKLWWFEQKCKQTQLVCNAVRSGEVRKKAGESKRSRRRQRNKSMPLENSQKANKDDASLARAPTIHRSISDEPLQVPRHFTEPDYYDQLRCENPISTKPSEYLDKAIQYLKEANEIVQGKRILYHIELARLYISKCDHENVNFHFSKAKECNAESKKHYYIDWAYFNEQLGLYKLEHEHNEDEESSSSCSDDTAEDYQEKMNRIEKILFASFELSVKAKSKSRMAYYKLTELLEKQSDKNIIKRAYLIRMYKIVRLTKKAEKHFEIYRKALEQPAYLNAKEKALTWKILKEYFCERNDYDIAIGFLQLEDGNQHEIDKLVVERFKSNRNMDQLHVKSLDLILPSKRKNEFNINVVVVITISKSAKVTHLWKAMKDKKVDCRMNCCADDDEDDIEQGENRDDCVQKWLENAKVVLVSLHQFDQCLLSEKTHFENYVQHAMQSEAPVFILDELNSKLPIKMSNLKKICINDVENEGGFHNFWENLLEECSSKKRMHMAED